MHILKTVLLIMLIGIIGCESRQQAIQKRRAAAVNNLKQIGLAHHAYHAEFMQPAAERESDAKQPSEVDEAPKAEESAPSGQ